MDKERLSTYLRSLETDDIALINDIEAYGRERQIPIARRETISFLQTIIRIKAPARILEVGTAIGYSALMMALTAPDAKITSIEIRDENYEKAVENVSRALSDGLISDGQIQLIHEDATAALPRLSGPYDLIFMDAAKGQYLPWLSEVLRLLPPGGVLFSDNVLFDETVLESRFAVERRDRTIHKRMRDYLYTLKHSQELTTSIIPVGDGVALTVRR